MEFPGKMDHATCLCFRVGRFPSLPEKAHIASGSQAAQVPPHTHTLSRLLPSLTSSSLLLVLIPSLATSTVANSGP